MRSVFPLGLGGLLFLAGCPSDDDGIKAFNAEPVAAITSHASGIEFTEGETVSLRGSVSDPDDLNITLSVVWYLGEEIVCEASNPDAEGNTTCDIVPGAGDDQITLEVKDPAGAAASAWIGFSVIATSAPEVTITSPVVDSKYYEGLKITFEGNISDAEDDNSSLEASWTSDIDGVLTVDTTPDSEGDILGFGELSQGEHAITLTAKDSSGKEGTNSVVINVGPPNSDPTCAITEPAENAAGPEGTLVTFVATVGDVDIAANDLTVDWSSDKDGALGGSTADTDGNVTFPIDTLSVNTHVVTMSVTDEVGASCVANRIYSVGTPPTVTVVAPKAGDVSNTGEAVSFAAEVADGEDLPTDLELSWSSDIDGIFSTQGADSTGLAQFVTDSLTVGSHTLTVTATDTDGLYSSVLVPFVINGLPTAPTVSLAPGAPTTEDDLTVAIDAASVDPEGDTVTYTYTWYNNGVLSTASTSAVLPSTATAKGELWSVDVLPNDGYGDGPAGTASVTIVNSDPVVDTVGILPATGVTTTTELVCSGTGSDPDGESLTETYEWTDSSGAALGSGDTLGLTASMVKPGETVTCTLTVTDGDAASAWATDSVTVDNTDPTVSGVTITSGSGPYNDSTLVCSATVEDADGGSPTLAYEWTDDSGAKIGTATDTLVLDSTLADVGDSITCAVTATDADGGTATDSGSVTVLNRAPVVDVVNIIPSTGVETDTGLTCTGGATDDDGETPTISYEWTDTTGAVLGTGDTLTLTPTMVAPEDEVTCTVTAKDTAGDTDSGSAAVTVENTDPVVDSITITPSGTITSSTELTCFATAVDDDLESPTISYAWTDGTGTTVGTSATYTLSPSMYSPGDSITCTATATDGYGGTDDDSLTVTISNSEPVLDSVALTPASPKEGSTLTCTPGTSSDPDGDTVYFSYEWYVGGTVVSSVTSDTLTGTYFDKKDSVYCLVTPNDGTSDGAAVASNTVVVENTAPVLASVDLAPSPATESSTLTCTPGKDTDDDGDTVRTSIAWTVNGKAISATTSTLTGSDFSKGDDVECIVTPNDSTEDGLAVTSNVVTIENSLPTVAGAKVETPPAYETSELTCAAGATDDADGDTVTLKVSWSVNGVDAGASTTLTGSSFSRGDKVACLITPNDGSEDGTTVTSAAVTINNSLPVVEKPSLTPLSPTTTSLLTCKEGKMTDADGDSVTAQYKWFVNGTGISATTGTLDSRYFAKKDLVVCSVAPYDGISSGTAVMSNVVTIGNTAPEVVDAKLSPATAYEMTTLTCKPGTTSDDDGDTVITKIGWTVNKVTISATGTTLDGKGFNKGDEVACVVTPNDGAVDGTPVTSNAVEILNTKPVLLSAKIEPATAYTDTELLCKPGVASDDDGDTVTFRYRWAVDSVYQTETTNTLDAKYFVKTQSVVCEVTPFDGEESGTLASSAAVVIQNSAPTMTSVTLSSDTKPISELSTLTCAAAATDADGDGLTYSYTWYTNKVAGTPVVTKDTSVTVSGADFGKDDSIYCTVSASDGTDKSTAMSSGTPLVILNSAPSITSATLTYSPATKIPTESSTFTCTVAGGKDLDGDAIEYTYDWYVGGVNTVSAGPTASRTATLDGRSFAKGDTVLCRVTPTDGTDSGAYQESGSFKIGGSVPSITGVSLTWSTGGTAPVEGSTVTCEALGGTDVDGDTLGYTYDWTVTDASGTSVSASVGPTKDTSTDITGTVFNKGDEISCEVTPSDVDGSGSPMSDTAGPVGNTPPDMTSVTLTYNTKVLDESSTLTCTALGDDEDKADTLTYTYTWYKNTIPGTPVVTKDLSVDLDSRGFAKGDWIGCKVSVYDGTSSSGAAPIKDNSLEVQNAAPSITSATLTFSPAAKNPTESSTFTCTVAGGKDLDGDLLKYTYDWEVGGVNTVSAGPTASLTATLDGGSFAKGDTVLCRVTPTDGTDSGAYQESGSFTVQDTRPVVTGVSLTFAPAAKTPTEKSTFTCTIAGGSDADGDTFNYNFYWYAGTTLLKSELLTSSNTATMDGVYFNKGQTVHCEANAEDTGGVAGARLPSGNYTIGNSTPTFSSAASISSLVSGRMLEGRAHTCAATATDLDPADLPITPTFVWTDAAGTVLARVASYTPTSKEVGTTLTCTATASDGVASPTSTASAYVNTKPGATSAALTPSAPKASDNLICSRRTSSYDADGDTVGYTYTWYKNSVAYKGTTSTTTEKGDTVPASAVSAADVWQCYITPNDGYENGTAGASTKVTVNSPPKITSVTLASSTKPPSETSTLTCAVVASSDADKDSLQYTFDWYVNKVEVVSGRLISSTSATLSGSSFSKGDSVYCQVTPHDGKEFGSAEDSTELMIQDSRPTISGISLTFAPVAKVPTEASTFTCTATGGSDEDGESFLYNFYWYAGTTLLKSDLLTSSNTATMDGTYFNKAQTVHCKANAENSSTGAMTPDSAKYTIGNSTPTISAATISALSSGRMLVGRSHDCAATATDLDPADLPLTPTYSWTNAAGTRLSTLARYTPVATDAGTTLTCTVIASDGSASATSMVSAYVNTKPGSPSAAIIPSAPTAFDDLVCSRRTSSYDADSDPVGYTYTWFKNSLEYKGTTGTTTEKGDTVPSSAVTSGDVWQCFITPNDGYENGTAGASTKVTVKAGCMVTLTFEVDAGLGWKTVASDDFVNPPNYLASGVLRLEGNDSPAGTSAACTDVYWDSVSTYDLSSKLLWSESFSSATNWSMKTTGTRLCTASTIDTKLGYARAYQPANEFWAETANVPVASGSRVVTRVNIGAASTGELAMGVDDASAVSTWKTDCNLKGTCPTDWAGVRWDSRGSVTLGVLGLKSSSSTFVWPTKSTWFDMALEIEATAGCVEKGGTSGGGGSTGGGGGGGGGEVVMK